MSEYEAYVTVTNFPIINSLGHTKKLKFFTSRVKFKSRVHHHTVQYYCNRDHTGLGFLVLTKLA